MAAEVENLAKLGWHITELGLKKLSAGQKLPESEIVKLAEDTDIKDYGKGHIPENWSKKDMVTIDGVLQVQKVRNVAAPKANEESQGAPRLLRVTLSDGATTVTALEVGRPWSRVTLRTPPGTKIRLRQPVPVCAGFLLVPDAALQVIGGNVQLMVDKWLMAKAFASQNLRPSGGAAGAPPPWVPFGKSISAAHKAERDFKSLVGGDQAPVDAEFEAQRKAQIAQLANTGRKQFGGGTKQMTDGNLETLMGAGFSQAEAEAALKHTYNDVGRALHNLQRFRARRDGREGADGDTGRGGRGGRFGRRRYDDDGEDGAARPSEPVTLLDFVGLKIGTETTGSSDQHSTPAVDSDSDRTGGSSFNDRGDRGGYGRGYESDRRGYGGDRGGRGRGYRGDRGGRGYSGDRGGSGRGYDNDRGERGYGGHRGGSGRGYSDDRGGSRGRGYSNDRGGGGRGYSGDRGGYNSDRGGYTDDRGGSRGRGYSNDRGGFNSDRGSSGRGYGSDRGGYNNDRGGSGRGYGIDRGGYNSSDRGGSGRGGGDRGRGGRGGGSERSRVSSDEFVEGRRARDRRQGTSGPRDLRTTASDTRSSPGFAALSEDRQMFPDLSSETAGQGGETTSQRGEGASRVDGMSGQRGETTSQRGDTTRRGGQTAGRGGRPAAPTVAAAAEQKHLYTEGEMCLALYWEDKQMYLARIISVGERTAVVNFVDYGEHYEEVLTSNMKPLGFEKEETPARQVEPRRSEKPLPMDREQSETSSLFSHSRRPAGRREEDDQRGYMDRPPRFNGTEHGGGDGDRGDTYRNDRRDTYRGDSRDTYRGDSRGGRGGRDRGGRGRGEYERPPRHQQQNGDYGGDRSSNHGYQQSDRGHFDDRPRRDGPRDGPRGGRGGGREQRGYEEPRQWMDRDTSVGGGRGRAAPREPEEDVPFTGTMEFRRGGRRPFVHRGGRD